MPVVLLMVALQAGAADAGQPGPTPREMAQLFFLAGDLHRAVESAKRCVQLEGKKKCEPLYRALVEYQALILRNEELTLAEAKSYLEWDRFVSPGQPGKLTLPVLRRYVDDPLEAAHQAQAAGNDKAVKAICERVLQVDPKNADAKQLLAAVSR